MADINVAEQADKKAEAKVEADHKVATEPHTIHGVRRMLGAPGMIPSIAAGAGIAALAGATTITDSRLRKTEFELSAAV